MAKKKQQRRRQKERRHEFEEAYYDAEGNEISREEYEELTGEKAALASASNGSAAAKPIQRGARTIHPPSWRRVFKRAGLFAPLMFLTLYFLSPQDQRDEWPRVAVSTAYLLALFIPFSYFMDRFMYRRFAARTGAAAGKKR